jgi:hypothetical protein
MAEKKYVVIPLMTGISGETSVTITNATFQIGNGEIKRYPDRNFGVWLVEQIDRKIKFLAISIGFFGIIHQKYYCPECLTQLNMNLRKPMETIMNLQYREYEPFILKITYPSVKCPKCNKVSGIDINDYKGTTIYGAINNAFSKENIKP